jgi:hypothetical protein
MAKRVMIVVVGAGIGSLVGLLLLFLGLGKLAVFACAVAGGIAPLIFLGPPGK